MIDFQLHLSPQAWAVLHLIAESSPDLGKSGHCQTAAWYNGRERGFSLVVEKKRFASGKHLVVVFATHRHSDRVFVDTWTSKISSVNPPSFEEPGYECGFVNRKVFDTESEAADHVVALIEQFVKPKKEVDDE